MFNKKLFIIRSILMVTIAALLLGCETTLFKSEASQQKAVSKPRVSEKAESVIQKGLGLSFDITPEKAKEMGFVEVSGCTFKKITNDDPFWSLKEIHFTKLSCKADAFRAVKYYSGENVDTQESQCRNDKDIILDIINDKYSRLHLIDFHPDLISLCDGEVDSLKTLGRCIFLSCSFSDATQSFVLNVEYLDSKNYLLGISEGIDFNKNNQIEMMHNRNIDPSQF